MNIETFMLELADLLDKYGLEIIPFVADEWTGYAERGKDIQVKIENTVNSNMRKCYEDFSCGKYITSEKLRIMASKRMVPENNQPADSAEQKE